MSRSEEYNKTFEQGWSLMSFPCEPTTSDPVALFASVSNDVIGMDGGIMKYYKELPSAGAGKGYWANFASATGTAVSMNCTAVTTPGFSTQLDSGWNFIGSPYQETRWSESTVDGIAVPSSSKISSSLYGYDEDSKTYYATNIMERWGGYAVKAGSGGTVAFNPLTTNTPPVALTEKSKNCIPGFYYRCLETTVVEDGTVCVHTHYPIKYELDGSGSSDSDGDVLTYNWTQTAGPDAEISSASSSKAIFVPVGNATYTFQLQVYDGLASSTDTLVVSSVKPSGKLTFVKNNIGSTDVFILDLDDATGDGLIRVTDHGGNELSPHWSMDGTKILFSSDRDGDWDIYTINADGTGITNISNDIYEDIYSDWSSSGRIVFTSNQTGYKEIFDMNYSGGDIRQLTIIGKNSWRPKYSFSEDKILFETDYGGDNYEMYVMDTDGSNLLRLTNDIKIQGHATWTTNGRILYTELDDYLTPARFQVMNDDGSNILSWPRPVGVENIYEHSMTADGRFIFYGGSDQYIHVMLSDGSADVSLGLAGYSPDHFAGP